MNEEQFNKLLQVAEDIKSEVIQCKEILSQVFHNGRQVQANIEMQQRMAMANMESLMGTMPESVKAMMKPFMNSTKKE